jgi:3-oxoacyl-[acyl-carrier protein] reductase
MYLKIDGNVAIVTASSSGLGLASAKRLAEAGVDVAINGRSSKRLEEAAEEVEAVANGAVLGKGGFD